jgi:Fur family ferric uptake transcriptional regulator
MRKSLKSPSDAAVVLAKAKLKRTKSRELLLGYLMRHHGPFSAKDIHAALKRKDMDAVTIYRCLAAFEEAEIVARSEFGDGIARFEYRDSHHHHHHVRCVSCEKIQMLDDCHLAQLEVELQNMGYTKIRHVLEFSGVCRECGP